MNLGNLIKNIYYRVRITILINYNYKLIYEKLAMNKGLVRDTGEQDKKLYK